MPTSGWLVKGNGSHVLVVVETHARPVCRPVTTGQSHIQKSTMLTVVDVTVVVSVTMVVVVSVTEVCVVAVAVVVLVFVFVVCVLVSVVKVLVVSVPVTVVRVVRVIVDVVVIAGVDRLQRAASSSEPSSQSTVKSHSHTAKKMHEPSKHRTPDEHGSNVVGSSVTVVVDTLVDVSGSLVGAGVVPLSSDGGFVVTAVGGAVGASVPDGKVVDGMSSQNPKLYSSFHEQYPDPSHVLWLR